MPAKTPMSTSTPVRRRPSLDVSVVGLIYCTLMMFMGVAAINTQANLLFGVFGLMLGTLLISGVISRMVLRKLRIRRSLPDVAIVGRSTQIVYQIANGKRFWPSLSVFFAELEGVEAFTRQPTAYLLHAAAGVEASIPIEVMPKRRGLHRMDKYQASTSFPFGFIKRAVVRRANDELLVLPAIGRVDSQLLEKCRSVDTVGPSVRPRRGGQDEFYGVKEYRSGENPRHIYWKRSARSPGQLVIREMTQVAPPKLLLLIDTYRPSDDPTPGALTAEQATAYLDAAARVERAIAMGASLAHQAMDEGLLVGLVAYGGDEFPPDHRAAGFVLLAPGRGKRHARELLTTLARLPRNTQATAESLSRAAQTISRSGISQVLITPGSGSAGITATTGNALPDHDSARRRTVRLTSGSPDSDRYFDFAETVDFRRCMPLSQQPPVAVRPPNTRSMLRPPSEKPPTR
jgi:uncharacterized protein (DUF58 family)